MMEPLDLHDADLRDRAVRAALGQMPFDVLITGGQLVDLITGCIRAADVGLVGPMIASVHAPGARRDAGETVDVAGGFLSAGLIDMHMHVESSMITAAAYAALVVPRGVTTVVWDPHELGNACGLAGVNYALTSAKGLGLRMLTLAPSCVPSAPGFETTGADFTPEVLAGLLAQDDIHGLAEVMSMRAVLGRDPRMSGIVHAGLSSGKRVCGHARGLTGAPLQGFVTAGIRTDHELTSAADLIEKLQAGLTIEMRGSHDHLLPEFVAALRDLPALPQTLTLCTDDVFIDELVLRGGLDDVVRRLVGYGMSPLHALQAATLNAATQLGRADLGLIAPGRRADIAVFKGLRDFEATHVWTNGKPYHDPTPDIAVPPALLNTVQVTELTADDFRIRASGTTARLDIIENPRFTQWGHQEVAVQNGFALCPPHMTRMAVVNRFGRHSPVRLAFLGEWGQWNGAFATTVAHDAHNLSVFGGDEANMALAANRARELGGGLVVVKDGKVLAELALPVAGLISLAPSAEIAAEFQAVRAAMDQIVIWKPPLLVFKACFGASLVCNAGPHLSDLGIVDTTTGQKLRYGADG
jgi:adenine deaminase